ncbi:MAG: hypothetical protein ACE5GX_08415 [Thermoanaerobaculia bacterium]
MGPQRQSHDDDAKQPSRQVKDLPGCIKYILLLLLLLLLGAEIVSGEFSKVAERDTLAISILGLKILLIFGLIWLIRVQRRLNCEITAPSLCATTEYDAAEDRWIIRVMGTASGTAFSHYELSVEQGGNPFPMNIFYPGGTANGAVAVNNGELGQLQVDGVDPGAGFTVILRVHPVAGSPKPCTSDFEIQRKMIYIEAIGGVAAHVVGAHPNDATEALKLVKADPNPATPDASVGGSIHVTGGADVYGCGREMSEYVLERREVAPDPAPPWEQDAGTAANWADINSPLPFGDATHPRTYTSWQGIKPNYVTNGVLTRQWQNKLVTQQIFPTFEQELRWVTTYKAWDTSALNSRYTVRVRVQHMPLGGPPDAVPPELYDSATVWIDNRVIEANITGLAIAGGGGLDACDELLLSQFITAANTKVNCDINGRAWDPLITDNPPFPSSAPNDNFDLYTLNFQKDGGGMNPIAITLPQDPNVPVPNVRQAGPLPPLPGGTDILQSWDIVGALDAGPPAAPDPSPKIYRGERCAYLIQLYVKDTTRIGGSGDTHEAWDFWPFCIMNDLPQNLPFPVPA